jgi:hypothetical protein
LPSLVRSSQRHVLPAAIFSLPSLVRFSQKQVLHENIPRVF